MKVSWVSLHPDVLGRGMWDQTIIERTLRASGFYFDHTDRFGGDILIFGGRHHAEPEDVEKIQERISRRDRIMVVVSSDEEGVFPFRDLRHPNMRLWVQHPRLTHSKTFGVGPSPHSLSGIYQERTDDYAFMGQLTHKARHDMVASLKRSNASGTLLTTPGFTQGHEPAEYINRLSTAKLGPSPSGPVLADTFRLYEALDNGLLPIVDDSPPHGEAGYWRRAYPEGVPFPIVDWESLSRDAWESWLDGWPANANRAGSWWQQEQWRLAMAWRKDLIALYDAKPMPNHTVLLVTSPVPSNPSTEVIDQTVLTIRDRTDAPMLILADGVRPEQEHMTAAYNEYLHRVIWKAGHEWDATVVVFDRHRHQAAMTRYVLNGLVDTPSILFVEHDTPLVGQLPAYTLADITSSAAVNVIRLNHETTILPDHQHLIEGNVTFDGVQLARTTQWSQRPHFANTDYYRTILSRYFASAANTMIEDRMHGVIQSEPWGNHRVSIYMPGRDIKRSTHLDARGHEPKFEETFTW